MNKSNLIETAIGIGVATAIGLAAGYVVFGDAPEAQATGAAAQLAGQNSDAVEAPVTAEPKDENRIAGTAVRDKTL
jgi:hypothetical protein